MRVNTRYINSTRGTSSKKDVPPLVYIPFISGTLDNTGNAKYANIFRVKVLLATNKK